MDYDRGRSPVKRTHCLVLLIVSCFLGNAAAAKSSGGDFEPVEEGQTLSTRGSSGPSAQGAVPAAISDVTPVKEEKPKELGPDEKSFSAVVSGLRKMGRTEVHFKNGEIYALPSGSRHNLFYKTFEDSEKTGKAVSVTVNTKSGVVQAVSSAPAANAAGKTGGAQ